MENLSQAEIHAYLIDAQSTMSEAAREIEVLRAQVIELQRQLEWHQQRIQTPNA